MNFVSLATNTFRCWHLQLNISTHKIDHQNIEIFRKLWKLTARQQATVTCPTPDRAATSSNPTNSGSLKWTSSCQLISQSNTHSNTRAHTRTHTLCNAAHAIVCDVHTRSHVQILQCRAAFANGFERHIRQRPAAEQVQSRHATTTLREQIDGLIVDGLLGSHRTDIERAQVGIEQINKCAKRCVGS